MSNEATIRSSLQIKKGQLFYQSNPTAFNANVSGSRGPSPGSIQVSTGGTNVDLSQLTAPGLVRIQNLDSTNFVEYGPYDPDITEFIPIGEILPGESYILRLSRHLGSEYGAGPGTGTTGSGVVLRIRANVATCTVLVEAFDR